MQAFLISQAVKILCRVLTADLLKELADKVLDFAEDAVLGTASTVDDALVLPICATIRAAFDIPDND